MGLEISFDLIDKKRGYDKRIVTSFYFFNRFLCYVIFGVVNVDFENRFGFVEHFVAVL